MLVSYGVFCSKSIVLKIILWVGEGVKLNLLSKVHQLNKWTPPPWALRPMSEKLWKEQERKIE